MTWWTTLYFLISSKPMVNWHTSLLYDVERGRCGLRLQPPRSNGLWALPKHEHSPSWSGKNEGSVQLVQRFAPICFYRVAHLVADNLLLTSNWELRVSIRSLYCDRTLNSMSTNSVPQPDGPACRWISQKQTGWSTFGAWLFSLQYLQYTGNELTSWRRLRAFPRRCGPENT